MKNLSRRAPVKLTCWIVVVSKARRNQGTNVSLMFMATRVSCVVASVDASCTLVLARNVDAVPNLHTAHRNQGAMVMQVTRKPSNTDPGLSW